MRLEHISNEFGDISTAVVYNFQKFLPVYKTREHTSLFKHNETDLAWIRQNRDIFKSEKVLYHGGLKKFDDIDFAEYDFRYILENHKFNSRSLLSYLDAESREKIGKNRGNLSQINSTIFPTVAEDSLQQYEYFNSILVSSVTSYLFSLDPGNYRIELFEEMITDGNCKFAGTGWEFINFDYIRALATTFPGRDTASTITYNVDDVVVFEGQYYISQVSNNCGNIPGETDAWERVIRPDTIILLGPDEYSSLNRNSYYVSNSVIRSVRGDEITQVVDSVYEHTRQEDEIYSGKVVWLAISPTNNIKELNLSYAAWLNSEDANRYKNKFNLRNDEYYGNCFEVTRQVDNTGIYKDIRSGKFLGTIVTNNCPILKKKLKKVKENYIPDNFDNNKLYNVGSIVKYGGSYWKALEDVIGIYPDSPERKWEVTSKPIVPEYNPDQQYQEQTEVTYNHKTWRSTCLVEEGQVPGISNKWEEVLLEYCPEVEYPINSRVTYEGKDFTVIKRNNRGHFPNMSPHWILTEKLTDYYTKRITIIPSPINGGYSIPGKQITIMNPDDNTLKCGFQIIENLGYNLNTVQWENNENTREDLVSGIDYIVTDYSTSSELKKYVEITREGFNKLLRDESRKRIIFDFRLVNSSLRIDDCYVNGDPNFKYNTSGVQVGRQYILIKRLQVIRNGVIITDVEGNDILSKLTDWFRVGDEVIYTLCLLDLAHAGETPYRFEECNLITTLRGISTSNYMDVSTVSTTELVYRGNSFIMPTIDVSTTVDYTTSYFDVKIANTRKVVIDIYDEFEISDAVLEIPYNNSAEIFFYGTYRNCLDYVTVNGINITAEESKYIPSLGIVQIRDVGISSVGTTLYAIQIQNVMTDVSIQIIAKTN